MLWLPWLPVPIVSALTIWEGPLEAIVWLAAIGGVLVARFWPARERFAWLLDRRRAPLLIAALALAASLTTAIALSDRIPGGDEPHYLIIAQSLLKDGDLRIQNNHDRGDYFAYFDDGLPPDFLQRGLDGQIYSIHAPGVAVLILPVFALAGYPGSLLFISVLCAAALAVNWRVAMTLTNDAVSAWAGALAVGLSATVFLHSFSIFPDPVGGAVVSVAFAMLVRLAVAPDAVRIWHVAATGALVGLLPWLHTRFAVIAGALGVVLAARLWARVDRWRMLAAFAAAPVLLAAGWFSYFWIIYGTIDPSAPYGTGQQSSWRWIGRGAVGLAFDQQFGLIANAPALALLPYGWLRLYRQHPRLALECIVVTVPYALVVASFGMWWGGWSAPARFLDSVLPIAVPLMALAWRDSNRAARSMFIALGLIGVTNVVLRIVVLDGLLAYNYRDGYDLLLDWLTRTVNLPLAFPGVHRQGALLAMVLASIWVAAGLVCLTILSGVHGASEEPRCAVDHDVNGRRRTLDGCDVRRVARRPRRRVDAAIVADRFHPAVEARSAPAGVRAAACSCHRRGVGARLARAVQLAAGSRGESGSDTSDSGVDSGGRVSGRDRRLERAGGHVDRVGRTDLTDDRGLAARRAGQRTDEAPRQPAGPGPFAGSARRRGGPKPDHASVAASDWTRI